MRAAKKNILIVILLIFQYGLTQNKLTKIEKLATTCKVWGFLKYYHPKVANGDFDWGRQLMEVLPKIEHVKNKEEFSRIIETWIDSLGKVNEIAPISPPIIEVENFDKNFDLSWINKNTLLSKSLSKKLKFIENNRFQGEQYYVGEHRGGNIFVKNEDYSNFQCNDKNSRLLALFTYWNLIEYFFPYKYLMDVKWDKTLKKMLPVFIVNQNDDDFYLAMQKLIVNLNDSHTVFYRYKNKKHFLPIIGKIIDNKIIVTEILNPQITETYEIKVGDVITKINDKNIKEIILENKELICASNNSRYLHDIVEPILSGKEDTIQLEFLTDNESIIKNINWIDYNSNRYVLKNNIKYNAKKEKFKTLKNNIGYVNMGNIEVKDVPEMIEKLNLTKAIVFDMRNYPKGTYEVISNFLNSKEKLFAIYTKPDLSYPGKYKWAEGTTCGTENNSNYKGKVVVLVNEETLSQSEWTVMCFQTAENTTIIGSQTAGADGNVSDVDYMKAFHSSFSGIGVYYPNRSETQRIGIIPDIEIKPTIKGIKEGKDEILDRAIQFIETGK